MSSVGNTLAKLDPGPALKSVGKTIESGVREIGKGAESVGREIGKVGEAAAKNPVGTIAKVAAIATGQAWALPLISATEVIANGGSIEQALKAGAISYAASLVAQGIADGLNDAFASELTSSVGDASLQATNTLADGTIQHVFTDGSTILQTVDGVLSTTPATIAPSVMSQLASQLPTSVLTSINTALANAGGSAAMTALQGGNLTNILTSGVSAGAGSFAGTQTSTQLKDLGLNSKIADVLGRTTGAATAGAVQGQDASQIFNTALVNNIVRTSLAEAGGALKNTEVARGLTKTLNEAIQPFKDTLNETKQSFLDQAKKLTELKTGADKEAERLIGESTSIKNEAETYYKDVLKTAESGAQDAYNTASSSFDTYKSESNKFSELVRKYDEAKAANNIELANKYADEANALIPTVNAATEKYNADYNAYELAKNDFESKNQNYLGYVNKLTDLNTQYTNVFKPVEDQLLVVNKNAEQFNSTADEMQAALNDRAKAVEEAYTKTSEYSPIAKSTFEEMFGETGDLTKATNLSQQVNALPQDNQRMYEFAKSFGLKAEDALQFAPDISKMSVVAQQTFYDSLAQNPDTTAALNTANQINSLDKAKQDSFFNAKIQGLDTAQAFDVASTVGGASKEQQQLYIDSVKSGLGGPLASIFAAAQGLVGPGTQLTGTVDRDLASLKTQQAKEAYKYYLSAFDPKEAFAMAQGLDQSALAQGTGTQTASTNNIGYLPPGQTGTVTVSQESSPANPSFVIPTEKIKELDAKLESGQITEAEYDQQYKQLVQPPQQVVSTPTTNTDYYQSLIDRIFTAPQTKAKTLATSAPSPTPGTTTTTGGISTGTTPGGGTTGTTPTGGATTGGTDQTGAGGTTPTGGTAGGTGTGTGGTGTGTGGAGTGGAGTGGLGFGIGGIGGGGFAIPGGFGLLSQDSTGGIKNLTAGLTERMDYNLAGLPSDQDNVNPMYNAPQIIPQMASGGSTYNPFSTTDTSGGSSISPSLTPSLTKAQINYILTGLPDYLQGRAGGGHIEGHNPQFYSEGGLSSIQNRFVKGDGDGTSDSIPAMLADGEFVIPADVVSSLGNGSNDAGASVLDQFLQVIREHKRKADAKNLPEDSKGPLAYLIDAQRRTKA